MKRILVMLLLFFALANAAGQKLYEADMRKAYSTQDKTLGGVMLNQQNGNRPCGLKIVKDSAGDGRYSAYFECREGDTLVGGKIRSEIGLYSNAKMAAITYWYCFGLYRPTWYTPTLKRQSDFQIADTMHRPVISLEKKGNKWYLINLFNPDVTVSKFRQYEAGIDTPGHETVWTLFFKPGIDSSGRIQLYRNGVLVTLKNGMDLRHKPLDNPTVSTIYGPNCYAIDIGGGVLYPVKKMYPKCGNYWYGIHDPGTGQAKKSVINITRIAFGGINSTIADFFP